METKQDKIITFISALLAAVILVVVIACNVGNDSSKTDALENQSEKGNGNYTSTDLQASIIDSDGLIKGVVADETDSEEKASEKTTDSSELTAGAEPETVETVMEKAPSKYAGKFLVNVDEFLFVRAEGSADAQAVGKIYKGCGGDVIEKGTEWSKIKSGNVEGYIKNEFAYFDEELEAHESEFAGSTAKSTVNSLRIRKTADLNGTVIGTIDEGADVIINELGTEWTHVTYSGVTGYVSTNYLNITYQMGTGITTEEEQAEIAEEEARKATEAAAAAEAERARQQKQAQAVANSHFVETVQTSAYSISEEDAYLIACVVSAEAGGDIYEDQLAVANVILNRLKSGRYGNSVSNVVYARGQFTVTVNGALERYMTNGPLSVAVQATKDAISGVNNVPNYSNFCALYAANYSRYNEYTIIGAQVFYR